MASLLLILLSACSRDPAKLVESGKIYLAEKKYSEAVIEFRKALKANPQFVEAHFQMGRLLVSVGQFGEAAESFQKVVAINPSNLDAQFNLGNLLLLQRKFEEARAKADLILKRVPDSPRAQILLGNTYAGIISLNDALGELRKGFELEPRLLPSYIDLAANQNFEPDPAHAEEAFKKAVTQNERSMNFRKSVDWRMSRCSRMSYPSATFP